MTFIVDKMLYVSTRIIFDQFEFPAKILLQSTCCACALYIHVYPVERTKHDASWMQTNVNE